MKLEYNQKQNKFHLNDGTTKESTHGWQTIAADVDIYVAEKFIQFAEAKTKIAAMTIEDLRMDFLAFNKSFNPDDVSFQDLIDEFKNMLNPAIENLPDEVKEMAIESNNATFKALESLNDLKYKQQVAAVFALGRFCNDFAQDFMNQNGMDDVMNQFKNK